MSNTGTPPADWAESALAFWFRELASADWFAKSDPVDATIRLRFLDLHERVAADLPDAAAHDARVALAIVILTDQMPRNMFRGTSRAFATDAIALAVAARAVDAGLDRGLGRDERLFLYVPFEHSESLADQEHAVALITPLGNAEYTRYAIAHREIIARFGRFPHRNAVLGRATTAEEAAFLETPGSSF